MMQHRELHAEILKRAGSISGDFKTEFLLESQGFPFSFDLKLLEDFIFVRKLHGDGRIYSKGSNVYQ